MVTAPRIRFLKKIQTISEKKKLEIKSQDDDEEKSIEQVTEEVIQETEPKESFSFMRNDDNFSFKVKLSSKKKEPDHDSQEEVFFINFFI